MPIAKDIIIRPKSEWQKDECFHCRDRVATIELIRGTTCVRCCGHPDCINKIEEFLLNIEPLIG
jgi:hypothetical protein